MPVLIPVYRYWFYKIPKYRYCQTWSVLEALLVNECLVVCFIMGLTKFSNTWRLFFCAGSMWYLRRWKEARCWIRSVSVATWRRRRRRRWCVILPAAWVSCTTRESLTATWSLRTYCVSTRASWHQSRSVTLTWEVVYHWTLVPSTVMDSLLPNYCLPWVNLSLLFNNKLTLWHSLFCHMGKAIKHPVPERVKPSFVILTSGHSDAQPWASECPDVKNYKWWLNLVWHRMLYGCTHMATKSIQIKKLLKCWHYEHGLQVISLWCSVVVLTLSIL